MMHTWQLPLCQISIALGASINQESHFIIIFILSINYIFFWSAFCRKSDIKAIEDKEKGQWRRDWVKLNWTVVQLPDFSPADFLCGCRADNCLFLCLQNLLPAHSCEYEPEEKWDILRQTFQKEDSLSGSWFTCRNSVTSLHCLLHVPMCWCPRLK